MRSAKRDPKPGIAAMYNSVCPGCGSDIVRGEDRVYAKRGEWLHIGCAPGADDE